MATGTWPTLADVASRTDSSGKALSITEALSQSIVIEKDIPWRPTSDNMSHEFAYRTSMPAGKPRMINQGLPFSKSTTGKGRVGVMDLEDWSQVDRLLAETSGMTVDGFRETEDMSFLEGMGQTVEQLFWYGNARSNPATINGFSTFYDTVNPALAPNADNVLNGNGSGNSNLSIWLIGWGSKTCFGVYPKNTTAGLTMEDQTGRMQGLDSLGNPFVALTTWYRRLFGLCIQDWRFAARYCNIDVTAAGLAGPNAPDLFASLRDLFMMPPTMTKASSGITESDAPDDMAPGVRWCLYTNRTGRRWLDTQRIRDRNVFLMIDDYAGKPTESINDVPIRVSDQLLINEATVV